MNDALYIAATGMQAQQTQLNVIANNVANVNTTGFKRSSVNFHDLVQREGQPADGRESVLSPAMSAGVSIGSQLRMFAAGDLKRTESPMDLAIQGNGFIEVLSPDGSTAYSRGGTLQVNADNLLSTSEGFVLKQRIQVPTDVKSLTVGQDGQVVSVDSKGHELNLGRLDVITFANSGALTAAGDNVFRANALAGEPVAGTPGDAGAGRLMQGYLENSNVKLVDEMVQLMVAQRAYEMNVKVIQAADEIAGMTNNLRK
ncbi:flagellar basal-body rod protein FlgG [Paucibacter sp. KBW04]|uniref:flagellar basal-body rod protein FlgG n=1 Tax=Paucibacter sp. KBW04 TaxID=2153361 RepID=UPI000F565FF6|nr:flagellar basal-body rod protein FlgG [Paucibacter sp. KBW04]RQO63587.1 flagellar basal-body rod protein FlgG [Paucibacter sp. KBW04]